MQNLFLLPSSHRFPGFWRDAATIMWRMWASTSMPRSSSNLGETYQFQLIRYFTVLHISLTVLDQAMLTLPRPYRTQEDDVRVATFLL